MERHKPGLQRLSLRLAGNPDDAADLLQESLVDAYRSFHRFTPGTYFAGWVSRIMSNNQLDRVRRRRLVTFSLDRWADGSQETDFPDPSPGPAQRLSDAELDPTLSEALAALPSAQQQTVELCDLEGATYEEAAKAASCPIGTIRSRLHRAHDALRQALTGTGRAPRPAHALPSSRRAFLRFGASAAASAALGALTSASADDQEPLRPLVICPDAELGSSIAEAMRAGGSLEPAVQAAWRPDFPETTVVCLVGPSTIVDRELAARVRDGRTGLILLNGAGEGRRGELLLGEGVAPSPKRDVERLTLRLKITAPRHPVVKGVGDFSLVRARTGSTLEGGVSPDVVLMSSDEPSPEATVFRIGRGRLFRFGPHISSQEHLRHPAILGLLQNAARWVAPGAE